MGVTMAMSSLVGSSSEERKLSPMEDTSMHSRARASHFFPCGSSVTPSARVVSSSMRVRPKATA